MWCTGVSLQWFFLLWSTDSRAHWLQELQHVGSVVVAQEHRLNSSGARSQLLHSMWDLPGSGIELVSPALAGGFFTAELPWKAQA